MGTFRVTVLVHGRRTPEDAAIEQAKAALVAHASRFQSVTGWHVPARPKYQRPKYRKQRPPVTFAIVTTDGEWHESGCLPYENPAPWLAKWPTLANVRNTTPVVLVVHW